MTMQQLIYASRPLGYSASVLAAILSVSRIRNAQHNITGALICRSDLYLQLLEGPVGKVETLFENICRDDRHVDLSVLVRAKVEDRLFPSWAMKHDAAETWSWSPQEIHDGILQRVTAREVRAVFVRSANQPTS